MLARMPEVYSSSMCRLSAAQAGQGAGALWTKETKMSSRATSTPTYGGCFKLSHQGVTTIAAGTCSKDLYRPLERPQ